MLMFRRQDRGRVADGEITVTYRLWKSPKVKAGKLYESGFGKLRVNDVQVVPAALVPEEDVAPTGCESVAAIWALAGDHTKTDVTPDTLLTRVQFTFLGGLSAPPKTFPARSLEELQQRLDRMDARSARGPWTMQVLRLIEEAPRVPARILSEQLDWERLDFKAHVRKLKALGLTISHEIGYEISEGGRRYLEANREGTVPVSQRRRADRARSARTRPRSR
jgi:hypothetical protein